MHQATREPTIEELAATFNYALKRRPLDTVEATELCRFSTIETLANMRVKGRGPRFFKTDKHVLYSEVDVLRWLYSGMATNTSQYPTHQQSLRAQRSANAPGDTSVPSVAFARK